MSGEAFHARANEWRLGATSLPADCTRFLVWAPLAQRVQARLVRPAEQLFELSPIGDGYFAADCQGVRPGADYFYRLHGASGSIDRPDPASRFQPRGVHEASQVVESEFPWQSINWRGLPLRDYIIYELHVGTFSAAGTLAGICEHLDELVKLGVTAIELMPVAQFPGTRNWGYDGVHPFAAQNSYGTPDDLKRLVDACHARSVAVVLDVVFNHLGPEGNYLADFGPYFSDRYRTPWGPAINFDGPHSDEVRRYFIDNALMWIDEFRIDALRLDAVHAIFDSLSQPFLRELSVAVDERAKELGRQIYLIAECNKNDPVMFERREQGGYGLDAVWLDDFQHALHALITGERTGWYADFGGLTELGKTLSEGFVLSGQKSVYRGRRHGRSSAGFEPDRFVVCMQNHDQIGNRATSDRLSQLVDFETLKLSAAATLLSPYVPLIFMGEEYGETAPFHYFVSHLDANLVEAVRSGRLREFAAFAWQATPADPQAQSTFERSKLNRTLCSQSPHAELLKYYKRLIELRKSIPAVSHAARAESEVHVLQEQQAIVCVRRHKESQLVMILHFGQQPTIVPLNLNGIQHSLALHLDSSAREWLGPGSSAAQSIDNTSCVAMQPRSCVVYA